MSDYAIHVCAHCGEYTKGKYCSTCTTKKGRDEIDKQNEEIRKEREAKK